MDRVARTLESSIFSRRSCRQRGRGQGQVTSISPPCSSLLYIPSNRGFVAWTLAQSSSLLICPPQCLPTPVPPSQPPHSSSSSPGPLNTLLLGSDSPWLLTTHSCWSSMPDLLIGSLSSLTPSQPLQGCCFIHTPYPIHHCGLGVPSLSAQPPQVSVSPGTTSSPSSPGSSLRFSQEHNL